MDDEPMEELDNETVTVYVDPLRQENDLLKTQINALNDRLVAINREDFDLMETLEEKAVYFVEEENGKITTIGGGANNEN